MKIVNVNENLDRNPFVFCYCSLRFGECEYSNFCYDKRAITCFKYVVKGAVDIAIRKKTIIDNMRDKNLLDELSYTNTNSSKQLFLNKSYYDISEQRISLI